jgi:hypothetical protein
MKAVNKRIESIVRTWTILRVKRDKKCVSAAITDLDLLFDDLISLTTNCRIKIPALDNSENFDKQNYKNNNLTWFIHKK